VPVAGIYGNSGYLVISISPIAIATMPDNTTSGSHTI